MELMFVVSKKWTIELVMPCEVKDEQYGLGGSEQYYFPYLISAEHE